MSIVVHFSPDLAEWLVERLDKGHAPDAIVQTMIEGQMEPAVARAIFDSFVTARRSGLPLPTNSVTIHETALDYVYETPLFRPYTSIETFDRRIRVLARAERPVLAVLAGLLSAEECSALIELARPRLEPSTVVDLDTGRDVVADYRKSYGMFFRPAENDLVARLDRRISEVMNLPVENGEGFQVLHYPEGGHSAPHFDFLVPSNTANRASIARSGQRASSLVLYLNDVDRGGETVFPAVGWSVSPSRGHGVYFEYANARGQVDHQSLHASKPVLAGEKWVATKWMRQRRFVSSNDGAFAT